MQLGTLSRAVGLDWHPNSDERLREIRDIRNRLTGHPARADKSNDPSSAILVYNAVTPSGFTGHVYYENRSQTINVEVVRMLADNEIHLITQMLAVEKRMDEEEQQFRSGQSVRPLASCFDNSFSYLLQRLWCDLGDEGCVGQAQTHARMIRDTMISLREALVKRGFQTTATSLYVDRIIAGLGLLEGIMGKASTNRDDQLKFDLIYAGRHRG